MRKIFYLLLVFVLVLFACSAGCTSSTSEMSARAATQTPLAPDFKYSVGDLLAETEEINSGVFIVDYQASTDKYLVMLHYRDSNEPQGIGIDEQLLWKDRVEINERYKYYVAHLDVKVTVVSPTPETAPTIAPTVKPTTVATPKKTPTPTPVPTVTPIRLYWKFSLGDVVSSSSNTNSNTAWVIVDYKDMTDEYYIRTISRTSSNEPWGKVSNADPPKWSGRVTVNKQYPYCIGHVDVPSAWRTTSNPTATPVSTTSNQDKELTSAVTSSRVSVGLLLMAVSRDYDQGDYYSMKSDGEKLEQTAQADYNKISNYRVSSNSQRLKTSYLSALNNAKNIGKYYKMAASEYIKGNDDKGDDYLDTAIWDYNPKYMVDLGVVIQEMGR